MSIKRIAATVGVSPSTVSIWVRDIELLPRHREALIKKNRDARLPGGRNEVWRELSRTRRRQYQDKGRQRARTGEILHLAGCMLYWAEGSKERNSVLFANSDPAMMVMFLRFLRECFGLTPAEMTLRLNVYTNNGLSIEDIETYWLELLSLPRSSLRKHMVNHCPTSSSGLKRNKLPYGVCTLRVKQSTWLVQHIYGAIQGYAGFDEPRWLDGPPRKQQSSH